MVVYSDAAMFIFFGDVCRNCGLDLESTCLLYSASLQSCHAMQLTQKEIQCRFLVLQLIHPDPLKARHQPPGRTPRAPAPGHAADRARRRRGSPCLRGARTPRGGAMPRVAHAAGTAAEVSGDGTSCGADEVGNPAETRREA